MSKLIQILDRMYLSKEKVAVAEEEAKQQIKELFMDLIGENKRTTAPEIGDVEGDFAYWDKAYNKAKDELRQKVDKL